MEIKIDYNKCCWKNGGCKCGCKCGSTKANQACKGCAEVCPVDAITRKEKVIIDKEKCIFCSACVEACPNNALSLV